MAGVERTALAFDRACAKAGVAYAYVGGVAVLAWGQPRATSDVDAIIVAPTAFGPFVEALAREGLVVDPRDLEDARRDGSHVSVFDDATGFHVDCKMVKSDLERGEIARARIVPFEDGRLVVIAPEEAIAFKLKFGSPQDIQDARSILVRQAGRLDMARLRALAETIGVRTALDALVSETD